TGIATDWQRPGVDNLHRIGPLPPDFCQPVLNEPLDVPAVSGLAYKQRPVSQLGKEVRIRSPKIGKAIFVGAEFEVFAADFHRDHFFIAQSGSKSASAHRIPGFDPLILVTNQTVDSNDKLIPIHWSSPSAKSWCGNRYSTERGLT